MSLYLKITHPRQPLILLLAEYDIDGELVLVNPTPEWLETELRADDIDPDDDLTEVLWRLGVLQTNTENLGVWCFVVEDHNPPASRVVDLTDDDVPFPWCPC